MIMPKVIFILFTILMMHCVFIIEADLIEDGEKYYVELERKSKSYGGCWKIAMSNLHMNCKLLTEDILSRLALSFANCFLDHAGVEPCLCSYDVLISDCLKNCSDRVFSTYTEFYTHTQSVCHYLQHREWQEETARTALLLTENSQKINKKLDESARSQSKILDLQRVTLTEQKRSLSHGKILNAELVRSRENARDLYNEFKIMTYEQKLVLFEIFDRMKNLQNFVLGEFTGVYTAAYYLVLATMVYILTSVPRTANARIWLILIISLNAVSEKFLTSYILQENVEVNPVITSELIYGRIWLCRKTACLICMIILLIAYYRYKDYNAINNKLLREIQQQNMELQNFIKGLSFRENFSSSFKTAINQSSLLEDAKSTSNTSAGKDKFNKVSVTNMNSQQTATCKTKDVENKENSFPSVSDLAASPHNAKVTPKRKNPPKKNSQKNQGNIIGIPLKEDILSTLESPNSPSGSRYNLRKRSSSQLNTPLSSPLR